MRSLAFAAFSFGLVAGAGCRSRTEEAPVRETPVESRRSEPAQLASVNESSHPSGEVFVTVRHLPDGGSIPEYREVPLRVDAATLARLLPPRPGLPVPLGHVRFRAPIDPEPAPGKTPNDGPLPRDWWAPPGFPNAFVRVWVSVEEVPGDSTVHWVESAEVILPRRDARQLVTKIWGEPTVVEAPDGERAIVWIDAEGGFHAVLEDGEEGPDLATLTIRPYTTLERILGDSPHQFGFESKPYLGMTVAEALAATPREHRPHGDETGIDLHVPAIELDRAETLVHLGVEAGRVRNVMVFVPYSLRPRVDALVAKKGPRFRVEDGGSLLRIHSQL